LVSGSQIDNKKIRGEQAVKIVAIENHLCPVFPDGHQFANRRPFRHDDRGMDAQDGTGPGNAQGMVTRRSGHHPSFSFLIVQPDEAIVGPSHLERARLLKIFKLEKDITAYLAAQLLGMNERGGPNGPLCPITGRLYVSDLAGAACGTILTGLVFLPKIGIIGVLISIAALKGLSLCFNAVVISRKS